MRPGEAANQSPARLSYREMDGALMASAPSPDARQFTAWGVRFQLGQRNRKAFDQPGGIYHHRHRLAVRPLNRDFLQPDRPAEGEHEIGGRIGKAGAIRRHGALQDSGGGGCLLSRRRNRVAIDVRPGISRYLGPDRVGLGRVQTGGSRLICGLGGKAIALACRVAGGYDGQSGDRSASRAKSINSSSVSRAGGTGTEMEHAAGSGDAGFTSGASCAENNRSGISAEAWPAAELRGRTRC